MESPHKTFAAIVYILILTSLSSCLPSKGSENAKAQANPDVTAPGNPGGEIKKSVILQVVAKAGYSMTDVIADNTQLTDDSSAAPPNRYNVKGSFEVGWQEPRNADEAARIYANNNICQMTGQRCHEGIHHTVFLNVVAERRSDGSIGISGDFRIDQPNPLPSGPKIASAEEAEKCKPEVTHQETLPPRYPPQAIRQHHEGKVVLHINVAVDGAPSNIQLVASSGYRELDREAVEAAERWTYRAVCSGTDDHVNATTDIPVVFSLANGPKIKF